MNLHYVANLIGDDTAKLRGRMTLDPMAHIDPIGIIMCNISIWLGLPVPINPYNFKNRKKGTILVSLAGPVMNFFIAFITLLIYMTIYYRLGFMNKIIENILINIYFINIGLGIFNLIPLPPLDGSKILAGFLPNKVEYNFFRYEQYFYILLILLIFTNSINYILGPMFYFVERTISYLVSFSFKT